MLKGGRDPGGGRVEPVNSVAEGEGGVRRSGSVPRGGGDWSQTEWECSRGGETGIRLSGSVPGGGDWNQTEWECSRGGGGGKSGV